MRVAILCLLLVAGCAGVPECSDAYQTGQRDGILNAYQSERLGARCGGSFDRARYDEGFSEGFSRRGRIMSL